MAFNKKQFILEQRQGANYDALTKEQQTKVDGQIYDTLKSFEEGNDRGFFGEILPTAFAIGGGIIGGIGGAAFGGVGAIPGAIAGAATGGVAGEAIQQKIEKKTELREEFDPGQIAATGATSAAFEATGTFLLKAGGKGLQLARPKMVTWLSKISGFADEVVRRALQRTPGAVEGIKEGEKALNNIVTRSSLKISEFANKLVEQSQKKIAQLSKLSGGGPGFPGTRRAILGEGRKFIDNTVKILRERYRIGIEKTGEVLFDRPNLPSNIVSGGERKAIQEAFITIKNVTRNTTIRQIDAVLEKLFVLRSKTPVGTPTGPETKKVIGEMIREVTKFVDSLGKSSNAYKEYASFLKQNLPKRLMINEMKDLFDGAGNLSSKQISKVSMNLLRLYNTGRLAVRESVEEIGEEIGEDIAGGVAGTLLQTGKEVLREASIPTRRGIAEKLVEFLPRKAVTNFIATGKITGELLNNPALRFASFVTGKSIKAILLETINLMEQKKTR